MLAGRQKSLGTTTSWRLRVDSNVVILHQVE